MTTPTPSAVALADQLNAAVRDAHHILRTTAAGRPDTRLTDDQPLPEWLIGHADRLRLALMFGTARFCPHIGTSPQVAHAAAWAPGLLVCPACIRLLAATPAADTICDRCHQPADRLDAGAFALGPILMVYGVCQPCHTTQ